MATSEEEEVLLTPISTTTELKELRDLYLRNWPENCVHYYCLDNFAKWKKQLKFLENIAIYTINGDWIRHGIYIIVDRYQVFVGALDESYNPLLEKGLALLDWKNGFKVSSLDQKHRQPVLNIIKKKKLKTEYDSMTMLYYMPKEEARKLEISCPPEYQLRALTDSDAELINNLWPNKHRGSTFFIKRQIGFNLNVGLFVKDTGELVAWTIRLQGGFAGALQVKEAFQKKGLGTVVLKAFSKLVANSGDDVMALVNPGNMPSRHMFDKVGFKIHDACCWIRTYPTKDGQEWPDGI